MTAEPQSRARILIVEDELHMRAALEKCLSEEGYRILTSADGAQGLACALNEKPDLILLDIMMPQMDGWEVLKLLRVDEGTADIPVAMLSARTEAKDRVQGLQEGAVDYICKPFSLQDLLSKISAIFAEATPR